MEDTLNDVTTGEENMIDDADNSEQLQNEIERLRSQNEEKEEMLADANAQKNRYKQKAERLRHENQKLKQNPNFIGTVQDIVDGAAIVKQHGNNQEVFTEVTDEMLESLSAGDRVTLNNSLNVVDKIPAERDARAQAMQVGDSPGVDYTDIGGLDDQIQEIRESVQMPMEEPEAFDEVGIDPPSGVLLHGPPGTGKTMMAKAVAEQTDSTFIKVAGSELVQKFIGEGARLVRDMFEVAREHEPAVLFIDEIDAIAAERTDSKTSGDAEVQRTMMQLLSEMDGFDERGDVKIIAATNRYDMLDEAILRPGRFDRLIEVPRPEGEAQKQIFNIHTRAMNLAEGLESQELANIVEDVSGAEIEAICTEAGMFAIRDGRTEVVLQDFEKAYEKVQGEEETVQVKSIDDTTATAFA